MPFILAKKLKFSLQRGHQQQVQYSKSQDPCVSLETCAELREFLGDEASEDGTMLKDA